MVILGNKNLVKNGNGRLTVKINVIKLIYEYFIRIFIKNVSTKEDSSAFKTGIVL
ncbi:hypothetical protein IGI49_003741 [Enterococcus sp. AZ071]